MTKPLPIRGLRAAPSMLPMPALPGPVGLSLLPSVPLAAPAPPTKLI